MANKIEHRDKGELVTNCDRSPNNGITVTTPIESRIMSIRGRQIMIDRDLAELYGVETKRLNEAVKRNIERFPERFRFQLTKEEMDELVANCDRFKSLKHSVARSYAFTEQGVAMLSTVLRSETAIEAGEAHPQGIPGDKDQVAYNDCGGYRPLSGRSSPATRKIAG